MLPLNVRRSARNASTSASNLAIRSLFFIYLHRQADLDLPHFLHFMLLIHLFLVVCVPGPDGCFRLSPRGGMTDHFARARVDNCPAVAGLLY